MMNYEDEHLDPKQEPETQLFVSLTVFNMKVTARMILDI